MDELNKVIVIHPAQINLFRKFEYVSALLEKVDDIIKTDDEITRVTDGQHVRAHLRRGHWHGFCSGKRDEPDAQKFAYCWLPQQIIGGKYS
ncbi:hypothetical protein Q6Y00_004318 [Salmonella enterica]|nr:hypothetical protein [Salmonella enterica]ECE0732761.1 hypothetical protein [Salmonella enterica subsp. houtenae]ECI4807621.1 hypothetical protein [Salmonella enterica subsp. houtenae]ECJ9256192.1 hypothetical protein [Salmonella enterica]EDN6829266.1 hypothetical protein [Salmonella enterica]